MLKRAITSPPTAPFPLDRLVRHETVPLRAPIRLVCPLNCTNFKLYKWESGRLCVIDWVVPVCTHLLGKKWNAFCSDTDSTEILIEIRRAKYHTVSKCVWESVPQWHLFAHIYLRDLEARIIRQKLEWNEQKISDTRKWNLLAETVWLWKQTF